MCEKIHSSKCVGAMRSILFLTHFIGYHFHTFPLGQNISWVFRVRASCPKHTCKNYSDYLQGALNVQLQPETQVTC